jgi:DNA-binding transcriptional LysR family regulator
MLDFRLQVFYTVARRLNFTRAAAELFISQPAVTRHIKELEGEYRVSLFERSGNKKIILTPAGQMLLNYTEKLLTTYREMEYDMSLLNRQQSGVLRLGASTTVAQYIIPPILAKFHKKFNTVRVNLVSGNTEDIEAALLNKEIDAVKKDTIKPDELKNLPILLREHGSGTLDVLTEALKPFDIKLADLNIEMQLGSTEAIKSYLLYSNCVAFLSVHAILKELKNNECRIIDVKGLCVTRPFHFIQMHGHASLLAELFIRFTLTQTATII